MEEFTPAPAYAEDENDPGPSPDATGPSEITYPTEPIRTTPSQTSAGVGLIWDGIGVAAGAALLGPLGALAGLSISGAVRNGVRAAKDWKSPDASARQEASKSATIAIFGTGIAGMLAFAAFAGENDNE